MGLSHLNRETLPEFEAVLNRFTPDTERRWGKLTPTELMAHLARSIRISLGEIDMKDQSNFFTRLPIFRRIVFEYLPWPPGKIVAPPEFTPAPESDFEAEREKAKNEFARFVDLLDNNPNADGWSPMFGKFPLREWSRMHAIHINHHLKQFGMVD